MPETNIIALLLVSMISLVVVSGDNKDSDLKLAQIQDCRLLADGIYSDPSDCHRYFHCSGSKTFYFRCYDGFVFDPCDLRCKMRDVCIPAEFCNKNLQNNLTLNMYRQTPSSSSAPADTTKTINEVIKLNELQNDAEVRDVVRRFENGRNFIQSGADSSAGQQGSGADPIVHQSSEPAFPPSSPATPDSRRFSEFQQETRRFNEFQQDTSRDYTALPTTTEELRLAVVRNFNGIEQSGSTAVLPNSTEYKNSRTSSGDSKTSTAASTTVSELNANPAEHSNAYSIMMASGSSTTVTQELTSIVKSDPALVSGTHPTGEPKEFAADTKENKKGPSELDEEKLSPRRLVTTTATSASPAQQFLSSSTHSPTSVGTTEATMTYIVKVVFSRRGRPDSQKGEPEIVEEGSTSLSPATPPSSLSSATSASSLSSATSASSLSSASSHTTTSSHATSTRENLHATTEVETRSGNRDHTNSARIKTANPAVKKSADRNITSNTSFAPLNNSLAVGLQNQGDPLNSVVFNYTSNPTESLDQFKNSTSIAITSTNKSTIKSTSTSATKSNVTTTTDSLSTTEEVSTTDFYDASVTETNTTADLWLTSGHNITSESWLTNGHQKTTSHQGNQSLANLTMDNHTTDAPSSKRTTSSGITVTISSAARLVNTSVTEEAKSVMSNITLSCNPTISSALCEKSDNQTREALARHCQQLTCNNGGMFISLSNGHCGCACPNGFKGENCLDLVDRALCHCSNGGRCVEIGNDTFACRCPLGYLGNKCQYPIDDLQPKVSNLLDSPPPGPKLTSNKGSVDLNKYLLCMVNHCSNGGICLKEIETGSSQCFCSHNFAGQYCEKKCINC